MTFVEAAALLELPRVLDRVAHYTFSVPGAAAVRAAEPYERPDDLARRHAAVRALLATIAAGTVPPGGDLEETGPILHKVAREGAVLELDECVSVKRLLLHSDAVRSYFVGALAHGGDEVLEPLLEPLTPPSSLLDRLTYLIDDTGRMRDDAVPGLAQARESIARANQTLMREAARMIERSPELYREGQATVRDGRVVLPLAANFRGRIDGIVHEASGSGETIFVEPVELIAVNNDLARAHSEVLQAIHRALAALSREVRNHTTTLRHLSAALVEADTLIARARYGAVTDGTLLAAGTTLNLREARHPLLGRDCIPLTVHFDDPIRLAVISGPNTGGKTVLLKTLGLLSMMNQAAIPVPAAPDSVLPRFTWWGVDIGDDQALDRKLSTFSAHIRRLARICDRADQQSFVLLDELGTGTDPDEGAALSLAIVDHLLRRGATIIVTTHQARLKHYGFTRDDATNVSMAFDERSHRPTYQVTSGTPGASHAIETAREQGLAAAIVDAARAYRDEHGGTVVELIERLTRETTAVAEERVALARERSAIEEHAAALDRRETELAAREAALSRETAGELRSVVADARRRLENTVRDLRERGAPLSRDEIRAAHQVVREVETRAEQLEPDAAPAPEPDRVASADSSPPREGDEVRHRGTGRAGNVKSVRGSRATVQFGAVRMVVPLSQLERLAPEPSSQRPRQPRIVADVTTPPATLELDLRGMRLETALAELERQVDAAVLNAIRRFSIIHGTGTGVLQKGVRDYLSRRSEVSSVAFAPPEEGGFGKTLVELNG